MTRDTALTWYDAEDHSPGLVCEVESSDGQIIKARFVCGSWETLDGEWIQPPVRFRILTPVVLTALHKPPFKVE